MTQDFKVGDLVYGRFSNGISKEGWVGRVLEVEGDHVCAHFPDYYKNIGNYNPYDSDKYLLENYKYHRNHKSWYTLVEKETDMTQDFKVGDKVRCIEPSGYLSYGKVYTVRVVKNDVVMVSDDVGSLGNYYSYRFELVEPAFDPTTNEKAWHFLTKEERKVFKDWEHGLEKLATFGHWINFSFELFDVNSDTILRAKPAPKVKEMTVAEIEEALGYQVKVVK